MVNLVYILGAVYMGGTEWFIFIVDIIIKIIIVGLETRVGAFFAFLLLRVISVG